MEELEKRKLTRVKSLSDKERVHQIMTAISAPTIRELVRITNEEGILKDDIVSILKEREQYILLYYK